MTQGKIILKGLDTIVNNLFPLLNIPAESTAGDAQPQKTQNDTVTPISQAISDSAVSLAKMQSLNIETLKKALDLYQRCGYSQEEVKELLDTKLDMLLETYEDLVNIKDLINRGIITDAVVRNNIETEDNT